MSEQQATPKQVIRNVATLDLRTTAPAVLANLKQIDNVATILVSSETAPYLSGLNMSNVASTIELPAEGKIITGQTTLSATTFSQTPLSAVIVGQLYVDSALTAEELERGLGTLVVSGQVLCPEHLAGVLNSKLAQMNGQFRTYPTSGQVVVGKVTLSESYLRQLPDQTRLIVLGKLVATQPLSAALIDQKVAELQVDGRIVCAEENSALLGKIQGPRFGDVTLVPSGFEVLERPLTLDAELLETMSAAKLYCTNTVQFTADVSPEVVTSALDKLIATQLLIAPAAVRKALAAKCNLLNTKAIFYTGKLWFVDGEVTLDDAWFAALEGQATLVVTGAVSLDPALDPNLLATRLDRVHNLGEISGSAAQLATLQARAGINEGEWNEATHAAEIEDDVTVAGNVAYLKL